MRIVLYADTIEEMREAAVGYLRQRAEGLIAPDHTKRTQRERARAAFELRIAASWLSRVEVEPKANAKFAEVA